MSGEDIRLEGYQPADIGITTRGFLAVLIFGIVSIALREVTREYFGSDTSYPPHFVILGGSLILGCIYAKLTAEKLKEVVTEKDARRARIWGVVEIMLGTTLAIGSTVLLAVKR